jgi:Zn-dependent peptidase ImmA (M78 family)
MTRREEIERRAQEILGDHGMLDMAVDPIRLANDRGIKVFNAKFGEEAIHGLLARRTGVGSIYVEADDHPVRKRFTVAHELGHFFLHLEGKDGEFVDNADNFRTAADPDAEWTPERRREWEANVFASAVLMPAELVRRKWPAIRDVEGMAHWFQVSYQAMAYRLEDLGITA